MDFLFLLAPLVYEGGGRSVSEAGGSICFGDTDSPLPLRGLPPHK